jgi:hypothetical protein
MEGRKLMAKEEKFRKCRNCGKDAPVGEACECGWDEDKARAEVRKQLLFREIERELSDEEKRRSKKPNPFGF